MTITGALVRSSSSVKVRPMAGRTPSTSKKFWRDAPAEDLLRRAVGGDARRAAARRRDAGERPLQPLPVRVVARRRRVAREARGGVVLPDEDDAIGIGVRQRPDQDGVDRGEDRRVGADAEGQRRDRDRGEARRLSQQAKAVAQIGEKGVHGAVGRRARAEAFTCRGLLRLVLEFAILGRPVAAQRRVEHLLELRARLRLAPVVLEQLGEEEVRDACCPGCRSATCAGGLPTACGRRRTGAAL